MSKIYHAERLRNGRYSESGQIYLITAVTHQRQCFFKDWRVGRLLVHQLRDAQTQGLVKSLAWVVMPDHFHWLVELRDSALEELALRVKSHTARNVNKALGRSGKFWQRGFHDRAIRYEEDLQSVARYIVANPVRAGLVRRVQDYPLWDALWV